MGISWNLSCDSGVSDTNVVKAWFALASKSALIWSDKTPSKEGIMTPGNPNRHLYAEFSTSCITGEIVPSKVTQEASLCDNDSQDGINRQRRVRLLNLEVTPVTRISNSAYLLAIG